MDSVNCNSARQLRGKICRDIPQTPLPKPPSRQTSMTTKDTLSYRDAGVDIEAGANLVDRIKPDIARTHRTGVLGGLGGFGGLFELPTDRYRQPVLVSGTDGVGTKLMLANLLDNHATIGIDLVAMCVNDIIVCGAEPLFFLDYYATGKLELDKSQQIIRGIADGCVQAGAALIGGETAEMPGMYDADDYDLAGFTVGVVEKENILDKNNVKAGHAIIGITSSGCHSNGYSLVRKVLDVSGDDPHMQLGSTTLAEQLIAPTKIYVKPLLALLGKVSDVSLAHITGGGITENLPRSMPEHTTAIIENNTIPQLPVFDWLQRSGNITNNEMLKTFNCGIGMAVMLPENQTQTAIDLLAEHGETAVRIGTVERSDVQQPQVQYV